MSLKDLNTLFMIFRMKHPTIALGLISLEVNYLIINFIGGTVTDFTPLYFEQTAVTAVIE